MKTTLLALASIGISSVAAHSAAIAISIDSGSKLLQNELGVALSGGAVNTAQDGTRVVVGYFNDGAQASPFGSGSTDRVATFVALTGPGSPAWGGPAANQVNNFTIGDDPSNFAGAPNANGQLLKEAFTINTGVNDALLPAPGTPLILRFFNSSNQRILDLANTNGLWNWRAPTVPPTGINISLDDPGLVGRSNGTNNSAFSAIAPATTNLQTLNPVPEPSTLAVALAGGVMLLARRKRH